METLLFVKVKVHNRSEGGVGLLSLAPGGVCWVALEWARAGPDPSVENTGLLDPSAGNSTLHVATSVTPALWPLTAPLNLSLHYKVGLIAASKAQSELK